MKNQITHLVTIVLSLLFTLQIGAQDISVFQFRQVPNDKVNEFIHRETTYWAEVAQKAVDKGDLITWALFQKVGGYDIPNSSNFLFINTVKDINANMGDMWNAAAVFPDVPASQLSTWEMSTVTSQAFVRINPMVAAANATPDDFNYVKINFWKSSNPAAFVALEQEHWAPFIKAEMAKSGVSQVGWSNAEIINPRGPNVPANSMSFDIYPTLGELLTPKWSEGATFPQEGLAKLQEITESRTEVIYRVVKVVSANN
ncbi:MAG: hypothetical protein HKN87_18120 [Saprospiraceae bacterium]|nr:hypothetical protein [Saprospiraceae bacterium]